MSNLFGKVFGKQKKKEKAARELSEKQKKWVTEMHAVLGIAQKQGESGPTGDSPLQSFEAEARRIAETDLPAAKTSRQKIDDALQQKRLALQTSPPQSEKERTARERVIETLEAELAEADEEIEHLERDRLRQVKGKIARLKAANADLAEETRKARAEAEGIRKDLGTDLPGFGDAKPEDIEKFRARYNDVMMRVRIEGDATFQRTRPTPKGLETETLPVLDAPERALLAAMQETALLLFQSGKPDLAYAKLEAVMKTLYEKIKVRTGFSEIAQGEPQQSYGRKNDEAIRAVEAASERLRKAGYAKAADGLDADLSDLIDKLDNALSASKTLGPEALETAHAGEVAKLTEAAAAALDTRDAIDKLKQAMGRDIQAMHANGAHETAGRLAKEAARLDLDRGMPAALNAAKDMAEKIAEAAAEAREDLMTRKNVDPKILAGDIATLDDKFDALFKHTRSGKIKTIEDHETQQEKGDKKNRNLPRETIDEIELRIGAAKQLAESGSGDAAAEAVAYLREVKQFFDNLEMDPKVFTKLEKEISDRDKALAKIAKKFPLYELPARKELEAELGKIRKAYMTAPPVRTGQKLVDIDPQIEAHKAKCLKMQARKRGIAKRCDILDKKLVQLGKILKAHFSNPLIELDGEHTSYHVKLKEVRELVARRSETSLEKAEDELTTLTTEVRVLLDLFAGIYKNKKNPTDPTGLAEAHKDLIANFRLDAQNQQVMHDRQIAKKKEFESTAKTLRTSAEKLSKKLMKRKVDASEADAIVSEVKSLEAEAKSSETWADALPKLEDIRTRYTNLKTDADEAAAMTDAKLEEAAALVRDKATELRTYLDGFVAAQIEPKGMVGKTNSLAENFEKKKLETYCKALAAAVPADMVNQIVANAKIVADRKAEQKLRKNARKEALRAVRRLMAVMEGFPPMDHFRRQPFDPGTKAVAGLKQALPRFEVKLLTTI